MSTAASVKTEDFDALVLESDVPVLVDFWAPWCPPCRMVGPEIDAVAETMAGRAKVFKLDVDDEPLIAERYGVSSIPALMIFKNGELVSSLLGAMPRSVLIEELESHL